MHAGIPLCELLSAHGADSQGLTRYFGGGGDGGLVKWPEFRAFLDQVHSDRGEEAVVAISSHLDRNLRFETARKTPFDFRTFL